MQPASTQIHSTDKQEYKFFTLLAVLYTITLAFTIVIENRLILIGHLKILSGTIILPLAYAISDIITEIYGYKLTRRVIWVSIINLYFMATLVWIIMKLPTDFSFADRAYTAVLDHLPRDVITYSIAAFVGIFLNSYLLSKWKILVKGKYFWLRSLGSSVIGEAIFILVWGFLGFSNKFSFPVLFELMAVSYLYKIICNIVFIIPSSLIVVLLKNAEHLDQYSYGVNFNPFRW